MQESRRRRPEPKVGFTELTLPRVAAAQLEVQLVDGTIILYSLIVSCQRHGKDPMAYMKDILTRLPRMKNRGDLRALTPRAWQPAAS